MLRRRPRSTLFPYTTLCRSISRLISAIISLTLSPALAARLLQPRGAPRDPLARGLDRSLGWLFRPFNRFFDRSAHGYQNSVGHSLRRRGLVFAVYAALLAGTAALFPGAAGRLIPPPAQLYPFC